MVIQIRNAPPGAKLHPQCHPMRFGLRLSLIHYRSKKTFLFFRAGARRGPRDGEPISQTHDAQTPRGGIYLDTEETAGSPITEWVAEGRGMADQAVLAKSLTERTWSSRRASIADSGTTVTTIVSPTALKTSME